jgi:hypothetical protein
MTNTFQGTCDECQKTATLTARVLGWSAYCAQCDYKIFTQSINAMANETIPFNEHDLTNKDDIFDLVIDGLCTPTELNLITDRLYADRRGGPLVDLFANEEFMSGLTRQLGANH